MMDAMVNSAGAAGVGSVVRRRDDYKGDCDLLMLYGAGDPIVSPHFKRHIESGRTAIGWDLGYYGRNSTKSYPMRMTINADHPQALIKSEAAERWDKENVALRHDSNPNGHIVLCGMGNKARRHFGYRKVEWEQDMLKRIRLEYPNRRIIYRPKIGSTEPIECESDPMSPINKVIYGASLVVVHHSNVAIDACIAGIPVVCQDGAAAALYKGDLCNPTNPTTQERLEFMRSLAWWQWRQEEAASCWNFIRGHSG